MHAYNAKHIKGKAIFKDCPKLKGVYVVSANGQKTLDDSWYWKRESEFPAVEVSRVLTSAPSSSIDPNSVSIPRYENDNYGDEGIWHSNGDPTQRKVIKFSTGERITLYRRPDSTRGWIYYPIEYGIDLLGPGWKTEEDAAAAGYVSRKYSKIRTVGRYYSF